MSDGTNEAPATKQVWRGTRWATVAADHPEAQAAEAAPAATGDAAPALAQEGFFADLAALESHIDAKVAEKFESLRADWTEAVDGAIDRLNAIVDQAKADLNTLLSGAIDKLDEKTAAEAPAAAEAAPAAEATTEQK